MKINFDKYDPENHRQIFIDKASFAAVTEISSLSSEQELIGSIDTSQNYKKGAKIMMINPREKELNTVCRLLD